MNKYRKVITLALLLVILVAADCAWELHKQGDVIFLKNQNLRNVLPWVGLFGILSLGQTLVIITGGIDLSIGSVIALVGILTAIFIHDWGWPPYFAIPLTLGLSLVIGLWQGVLIAKVKMQPFVVTLCSLFFLRGITRLVASDSTRGFGIDHPNLEWLGSGFLTASKIPWTSVPFIIFLLLVVFSGLYLHFCAQGRYIFAIGASEDAAHFSGIPVVRVKIIAYVLCSLLSGVGGLLLAFNVNSLGPTDFGNGYELYAIAGAVLGGCSLRGGSGNILGVVIGAALIVVLRNLVNILGIPSQLEYVVIGGAILLGVFADEVLTQRSATRVSANA